MILRHTLKYNEIHRLYVLFYKEDKIFYLIEYLSIFHKSSISIIKKNAK